MTFPKVIGVSGVARSGKDTFCEIALAYFSKWNILGVREAFADQLKKDLDSFLIKKFSISSFTTNDDEKKIIRPIMVSYGEAKRNLTKGMCWIDKLKKNIEKNIDQNIITFISDVRYPNESNWIKKDYSGVTIHINRENNFPANDEEQHNDPLVQDVSEFKIHWPDFQGDTKLGNSYVLETLQKISRPT
tara:strand:- start:6283 stop:6849 length:567 start_codon:yes stop_codon:yes gene_type:complete